MKSFIRLLSFILLISLLAFACKNQNPDKSADVITINLERMVDQNRAIGLSEIAKEVSYIPLETVPEAMLSPSKLLYVNKNIFVLNRSGEVYLFNDAGEFIRQIGKIGKGPDEYVGGQYMEVSPDGSLIYIYNQRFGNGGYTYDLDGNQLNSFKMKYATWRYAPLSEGRHIMISPYGSFSPDSLYHHHPPGTQYHRRVDKPEHEEGQ